MKGVADVNIDVFLDTVCPWCRVGKQHLFEAVERWNGEPVEVHFRAFLLDPGAPEEGRPASSLNERLGGEERVAQAHARVCEAGDACGLRFDFERIDRLPNTLLSHQLIQIAPYHLQTQMVEAITKAYFEDGLDIGDLQVLLDVAEQVGCNRSETSVQLTRGDGKEAVNRDLRFAQDIGITGVPLFIINNRYAISGAQPAEVFLQTFERAVSQG